MPSCELALHRLGNKVKLLDITDSSGKEGSSR